MDVDSDKIHIGSGVSDELDDVLRTFQNPVFICDSVTRAAAEPYFEEELKDCLVIELAPEGLAADEENIKRVLSQLEVCDLGQSSVPVDLLIAIGHKTIHDLTRVAAKEYEIPFASVPTATDGTDPQVKSSAQDVIPAIAPGWVFAEPRILCDEDASHSEKIETIEAILLACGLERESFREQLMDSETL